MTKLELMHKLTFAPCNVRCCSSISHVLQTAYEKSDMGKILHTRLAAVAVCYRIWTDQH
jgi:hypothetical protein